MAKLVKKKVRARNPMRPLICSILTCTLLSCYEPGGGMTGHHPPEALVEGQVTELEIEVTVWGAGSGKMSDRWKDVKCYYRLVGTGQYTSVDMTLTEESAESAVFACQLPAQSPAGGEIEYYFEKVFDGHLNKTEPKVVPIVATVDDVPPSSPPIGGRDH